jgi:hypothetical protein
MGYCGKARRGGSGRARRDPCAFAGAGKTAASGWNKKGMARAAQND